MIKFLNGFVKLTGWPIFALIHRTKYYYEDKAVQSRKIKGKAIIMSDHHAVWDFATMMFAFPGRILRCVIAELMFEKSKLFGWFLKNIGGIRVDRNEQDFAFITKSCEVLDKGGVVEIYPESRIPNEGEITPLPFKPSTVYIALSTGAPIIPVVSSGNYFCFKRLRVLIGKPIDVRELFDDSLGEKANIENINEILRNTIIRLQNELQSKTKKD